LKKKFLALSAVSEKDVFITGVIANHISSINKMLKDLGYLQKISNNNDIKKYLQSEINNIYPPNLVNTQKRYRGGVNNWKQALNKFRGVMTEKEFTQRLNEIDWLKGTLLHLEQSNSFAYFNNLRLLKERFILEYNGYKESNVEVRKHIKWQISNNLYTS